MTQNVYHQNLIKVRAGFVALTDCAPLLIAAECGFAADEGIDLDVRKLPSWSALRDKIAFAHLDCAAMLAGLPLALHLGLGGLKVPMLVPMTLGPGFNGITLSNALIAAMQEIGLKKELDRRAGNGEPVRLAMVYPWSCQNYELRAWLDQAGIDADKDVELIVIPPSRMVESLRKGDIDGFCVGEPWNQLASDEGLGQIVARKRDLFPGAPEKVLGFSRDWAEEKPELVMKLVRAMTRAMQHMADPDNRQAVITMLSGRDALDVPEGVIERQLQEMTDLFVADSPYGWAGAWSCPWTTHGDWLLEQMRRWGQTREEPSVYSRQLFRPDIFRKAVLPLGASLPEDSPAQIENDLVLPGPGQHQTTG